MSRIKNLQFQRFGRLVVLSREGYHKNSAAWRCSCDCGSTVVKSSALLTSGKTKSCGCLVKEQSPKNGGTHGLSSSPAYMSWAGMKNRCRNKSQKQYKDYGGRGIYYCSRWESFENFYADMGDRPDGKTLERIDNDKGYSPENCTWATPKEQMANQRCTQKI